MAELRDVAEARVVVPGEGEAVGRHGQRAGAAARGGSGAPRRAMVEGEEQGKHQGQVQRPAAHGQGQQQRTRRSARRRGAGSGHEGEAEDGQAVPEALPLGPDVGAHARDVHVGAEHEGEAGQQRRRAAESRATPQDRNCAASAGDPEEVDHRRGVRRLAAEDEDERHLEQRPGSGGKLS